MRQTDWSGKRQSANTSRLPFCSTPKRTEARRSLWLSAQVSHRFFIGRSYASNEWQFFWTTGGTGQLISRLTNDEIDVAMWVGCLQRQRLIDIRTWPCIADRVLSNPTDLQCIDWSPHLRDSQGIGGLQTCWQLRDHPAELVSIHPNSRVMPPFLRFLFIRHIFVIGQLLRARNLRTTVSMIWQIRQLEFLDWAGNVIFLILNLHHEVVY